MKFIRLDDIHYSFIIHGNIPTKPTKPIMSSKAIIIARNSIPQENQWNDAPEEITIFWCEYGFGLYNEIPDGYGSWTYAPEVTSIIYPDCDFEYFCNMHLTQDQREYIDFEYWGDKFKPIEVLYGKGTK